MTRAILLIAALLPVSVQALDFDAGEMLAAHNRWAFDSQCAAAHLLG